MKHELRQFLEKEFQSCDDLKGLSERLKTSAAAIEVMIAPDSHNDINLAGVNKSAANLILSALFQGKPYESYIDNASKTKEITLDLSQPIKELKRFNKQLNKSIELQAGIPSNLAGTGMNCQTYKHAEKQRECDRKTSQENEAIAKDLEEDVKTLETVLDEGIAHLAENAKEGRTSCNMEEAHNAITCLTQQNIKIVKVLQKRLQNGNI